LDLEQDPEDDLCKTNPSFGWWKYDFYVQ